MYTCPYDDCGAVSHNPNDAREQYCGRCHRFAHEPALIADLIVDEMERLDELRRVRSLIGQLRRREEHLVAHGLRVFADPLSH